MPILDVDLLAYERGTAAQRRAVVDGVRRSLETGFVYCRHDVPESLIDEAYGLLEAFFHLPRAEKERYVVPGSHGQTGYTGLLVETAASATRADFKEMLNWGEELRPGHPLAKRHPHRYLPRRLPDEHVPGASRSLGALHDRLLDLGRRFLRIVADGLGAHPDYFAPMLEHGPTLTRALRYPPMAEAPPGGHVWAEAHADINLVTALPRATASGLEVETADGWVPAAPPEGLAILNTGLMLERVSNGLVPAGVHRVVSRTGDAAERLSVVQFCHPTPSTVLAPLPTCISGAHPARFPAVSAGDWLDQVLYDINLIEDARRTNP